MPDEFIGVAEGTGLIIGIGRWVLHEACRAAVRLQRPDSPPLLMHVNLSPQQLHDPTIADTVAAALAAVSADPSLLVLEVTEGSLLDDRLAVERLHQLRALGVRIAVDDFGTGYASISYLQQLPIQTVKIDRSFVSGGALEANERNAFLHTIVGLAKSLNLRSVAEGIESVAQLGELQALGCDSGQGYLWGEPMPLDEVVVCIASIEADRHTAKV